MSDTGDSASGGPTPAAQPAAEQGAPPRTSRREFLIGVGTASVAAAGAGYITFATRNERLSALGPSHARRVAAVRPVVTAAPKPTRADWAALRAHLSTGRLVRPHENGYDQARHLFQPRFDHLE